MSLIDGADSPGVMAFESQLFLFFVSSETVWPIASNSRIASFRSSSLSAASCAALNRLDRCWFIFARGATPSASSAPVRRGGRSSRPGLTNGHHEHFSRSGHVDNPLRVFEDLHHHLLLGLRSRSTLGMGTWVDDTVHIHYGGQLDTAVLVTHVR